MASFNSPNNPTPEIIETRGLKQFAQEPTSLYTEQSELALGQGKVTAPEAAGVCSFSFPKLTQITHVSSRRLKCHWLVTNPPRHGTVHWYLDPCQSIREEKTTLKGFSFFGENRSQETENVWCSQRLWVVTTDMGLGSNARLGLLPNGTWDGIIFDCSTEGSCAQSEHLALGLQTA